MEYLIKNAALACLFLSAAHVEALELPSGISVNPATGQITVDGKASLGFCYASPGWKSQIDLNRNTPLPGQQPGIEAKHEIRFQGRFPIGAQTFDYTQSVKRVADNGVECEWGVKNATGVETGALFAQLKLPASEYQNSSILVDGAPIVLPEIPETFVNITSFNDAKTVTIPTGRDKIIISGTLNGTLMCSRGDSGGPYYALRLPSEPSGGKVTQSDLHFKITKSPFSIKSIPINQGTNSTFDDPVADDDQGGWTDQGPARDMKSLLSGDLILNGIPFNIIESARNKGTSCIVLRGAARPHFPEIATVPMEGQRYRWLYLLHATAWTDREKAVGSVSAVYQDGTRDVFNVLAGRDASDWTSGRAADNCSLAWTGTSAAFGNVFLYTSSFPLRDKPLKEIIFTSGKTGPVWMIAAVSGSEDQISPTHPAQKETVTYRANADWRPVEWQPMAMIKGSALDFSRLLDAPAGKHGDVICKGDNFYFKGAPEVPLRFYGNTLFHSVPFVDKKRAGMLADFIASAGYNVIRFHCYLKWLSKDDGSPALNPEALDQIDYFLHCLAERGVYYTFPLYGNTSTAGAIIQDPEIPEYSNRKICHELRGLVPISEPAREYMRAFSRNLLLHVNPYTGVAVKDDPALLSVELLNEDSVHGVLSESPDMRRIYLRKCREYLRQKNGKDPSDDEVEKAVSSFIIMVQNTYTRDFRDYLRGLGVNKPITDKSAEEFLSLAPIREQLDYVDVHAYWDIAEGVPTRLKLDNPNEKKWKTQLTAGAARLFGKPFSQGEYNTVYPSPYWAYIGPAESAIAALQNWSMIICCGIGTVPEHVFAPYPAVGIKMQNPMMMLSERIGAVLFASGAMTASKIKVPYVVTREYIERQLDGNGGGGTYPEAYTSLGLSCQIGTVIWKPGIDLSPYSAVVVPPDMELPEGMKSVRHYPADSRLRDNLKDILPESGANIYAGTTGQSSLNAEEQTFKIVTARAECFLLPSKSNHFEGNRVAISGNKTVSTCFVSSLDDVPIGESRHLLAFYITDLKNTGTVVDYEKSGAVFQKMGDVPFLLRQGEVVFSVKTKNGELPKIWALKYDGSRAARIEPEKTEDGFTFVARAVTSEEAYFAYEIAW